MGLNPNPVWRRDAIARLESIIFPAHWEVSELTGPKHMLTTYDINQALDRSRDCQGIISDLSQGDSL